MKQQPPFLKHGARIGIVTTARFISPEELEPAIGLIKKEGFEVVLTNDIYKKENQFGGSDLSRSNDLNEMLNREDIDAVLIARGGYGTLRIIDTIDFAKFKKKPKWIIGYSDVTVLHSAINVLTDFASLHATMPINFTKNEEATNSLFNALKGKPLSYNFPVHELNRKGIIKGEVVGGNLSLLYALSASNTDINCEGKVLFIEDLDEYFYHIDRMILQLKRSGKLKHLKGLIVGGMTDMKDNAILFGKNVEEIILDAVKEYNYPVCFGFPAGHIDRNLALKLGCEIIIEMGDDFCTSLQKSN